MVNKIEIDLHAEMIIGDTRGMSNWDILSYQLETFTKALEQHKRRKGCVIIFIHGKGTGKLRSELLRYFRQKYNQNRNFRLDESPIGYWGTAIAVKVV